MNPSSWWELPAGQWDRLRALLDEGMALPADARPGWLASLPPQDAALGQALQSLLSEADDPALSLDSGPRLSAALPGARAQEGEAAQAVGAQVGPYRLLRPLGEGGMASVWLAERHDQLLQRQVALKLPHHAAWRPGLAERFARERAILATLVHPHIARLYDAGVSADGQPWLALEHVEGQRLDAHAQAAGLTVAQRIELVLQVMDAVAYAHAHLVVHRDIKPGNILVTPEGQVRLLDFGIAKLLDEDTAEPSELTREVGGVMTLHYAAPEQLQGGAIGTAADVYALGVLLFELLTGERPFRLASAGRSEIVQATLNTPPRRPSEVAPTPALRRALRGDLDTILAKALQKSPGDRYASVEAFADDLRRHLQHLPLKARPDPWWVQWRKLVWRHRVATAAASVALSALLVGTALALWQASEARLQRDAAVRALERADREAAAARQAERVAEAQADLSSFVLSDFAAAHSDAEMRAQLESALLMVRGQYRDDPALRGQLLLGVGEQFRWISEHARADAVFAEARELLARHGDPGALSQLLCILAAGEARNGAPDAARALIEQARQTNPLQSNAQWRARVECLMEEALISRYAGAPLPAIALIEEAVAIDQRLGRGDSEGASEAYNALARAQLEAGRFADAVASARRSAAVLERIGRTRTPGLRNAWGIEADALRMGGRPLDAERAHRGGGAIDPMNDELPLPLRMGYGNTLRALGREAQAMALYDRLVREALAQGAPNNARYMLVEAVEGWLALGRPDEARRRLAQAQPLFAKVRAKGLPQARMVALAEAQLALAGGQTERARRALDEAREVLARTRSAPAHMRRPAERIEALLAWRQGDPAAALVHAEDALALSRQHALDANASLWVGEDLWLRARLRQASGRGDQAREDAAAAAAQVRASAGQAHPLLAEIQRFLR